MKNVKRKATGWQGFYAESKSYMDYDTAKYTRKLRFWLWYPFAFARYYSAVIKDWYYHRLMKRKS